MNKIIILLILCILLVVFLIHKKHKSIEGFQSNCDSIPANGHLTINTNNFSNGIVGNSAFSNCQNLSSLTIESDITSIDSYAFFECPNLHSVIIRSSNGSDGGGLGVLSIGFSALGIARCEI